MRTTALAPAALALLLVVGCTGPGDEGDGVPTSAEPVVEAATGTEPDREAAPEPDTPEPGAARTQVPAVGCAEIAGLLAPLADGLVDDPVAPSYSTDEEIWCSWVSPESAALGDIRSLAVQVSLLDDEVPDPEEAAAFGVDFYVTDPRLEPYGGVAIWIPAGDDTVMGGGVGTVLVPGLEVSVTSGGFGKETGFSLEHVITLALTLV